MKPGISPTIDFWISVVLAVIAAVATGAVPFPDTVSPVLQHELKQWAAFIVGYYTILAPVFPGLSSAKSGPLVSSSTAGAGIVLLAGFLLLAPSDAHASTARRPVHAVPAPVQHLTIPNLPLKILNDAVNDLTAAKGLADAQKDTVASSCYAEVLAELAAVQASQSGTLPEPHLFYAFQTARGFANAVLPNSALNNACAPLAQQVKLSVLTLINGLVTGGLGIATIGPMFGLP